jgi:hypothetical protein
VSIKLNKLILRDFGRFAHHEILFSGRTLLVGRNNAGKSTVIRALRLVGLVTNRLRGLNFEAPPEWLDETPVGSSGVRPSLRGLDLQLGPATFHAYTEPPARITAVFSTKWSVDVFVGVDEIFGVVKDAKGVGIASRRDVLPNRVPRLGIQPQVGPVDPSEELLKERTIIEGIRADVSAAHFRNQLNLASGLLPALREAAADTWPGLEIRELDVPGLLDERGHLTLNVRDGPFVGELAAMGHGLQMWLQMLWFLIRAANDESRAGGYGAARLVPSRGPTVGYERRRLTCSACARRLTRWRRTSRGACGLRDGTGHANRHSGCRAASYRQQRRPRLQA